MKFTIITACRNASPTVAMTLDSVARQRRDGFELEYIVIDGASTDGTAEIVRDFAARVEFPVKWLSEPDRNLYDGLNKGVRMATGEVIGILNADDVFATDDVLAKVAGFWSRNPDVDLTYGDVRFAYRGEYAGVDDLRRARTKRYLSGRWFRKWMFRFAAFPAHPSTFVRRTCHERFGLYSLDYSICADFEMMLRLFVAHGVKAKYLPLCTTVMRPDGMSTAGIRSKLSVNAQDLRALRANGLWSCLPFVYAKYLFKIWGYVFTRGRR